ncbi:MAG: hypothetical protein ACK5LO_09545 [Leucobacter sp.]
MDDPPATGKRKKSKKHKKSKDPGKHQSYIEVHFERNSSDDEMHELMMLQHLDIAEAHPSMPHREDGTLTEASNQVIMLRNLGFSEARIAEKLRFEFGLDPEAYGVHPGRLKRAQDPAPEGEERVPKSGKSRAEASYHQFYLASEYPGSPGEDFTADMLIYPLNSGVAMISTSVWCGEVRVKWALHPERPPKASKKWDRVQEVRVTAPASGLYIDGWGGESHDPTNLAAYGAGDYIVRCCARGGEDEYDDAKDRADEHFLIELWPAEG